MADGGFNEGTGSVRRSFLSSAFEAVEALALLRAVPNDVKGCNAWFRGHQTVVGGFARDPAVMDWGDLIVGGKKEVSKPMVCRQNTDQAVKALATLHPRPKDHSAFKTESTN